MRCPRCGDPAEIGVLCEGCAGAVPACAGLQREHVASRTARADAVAWLIDPFGCAHALSGGRTSIGRRPDADVVLLHGSISRDHAELAPTGARWQLRDLGSRNGCHVDGKRIDGRAELPELAVVKIGEVALWFVGRAVELPPVDASAPTAHADAGTLRLTLRGAARELCVVGHDDDDAPGGALLHRAHDAPAWAEVDLPALEFQLLRALCRAWLAEATSPAPSRGCVTSKQLAGQLPFQSRYPSEDNVRQLVRRFRVGLEEIGAVDLIEAVPSRGYRVAWTVVVP